MAYIQKPDGHSVLLYRTKRHVFILNPTTIARGKPDVIRYYYGESYDDATQKLLLWVSEMARQMNYSKYFGGTAIFLNQMARRGMEKIDLDDLEVFMHMARTTIEEERKNPQYIYKPKKKKKKRKKKRKKPVIFQPISLE